MNNERYTKLRKVRYITYSLLIIYLSKKLSKKIYLKMQIILIFSPVLFVCLYMPYYSYNFTHNAWKLEKKNHFFILLNYDE